MIIICKMWDFKFNAPEYFNFFRKQKKKLAIQLDLTDQDDQWFMLEHAELTPIKQSVIEEITIQCKKIQIEEIITTHQIKPNYHSTSIHQPISKPEIYNKVKKQVKKQMKKISCKPMAQKIKRSDIYEKYEILQKASSKGKVIENKFQKKSMKSFLKKQEKAEKISKSKSLTNLNEKSKSRMPCPYPLRVQRNWETKSNKTWYSLSNKSVKQAMESMKKMNENRKKNINNKKLGRFRF